MDFSSITDMNSYLKTMKLKTIWKQKASNPLGSAPKAASGKGDAYKPANPFGDERLMGIKTKLQAGKKLSGEDMEYLRENDPTTYEQVKRMEREKIEYEKELRRCKTKDDARAFHINRVTNTLAEAKSGAISPEVALAKLTGITETYQDYTKSSRYAKMAENHAELARAIKEVKAVQEKKETEEPKAADDENASGDDEWKTPAERITWEAPGQRPAPEAAPAPSAHQDGPRPVEMAERAAPATHARSAEMVKASKEADRGGPTGTRKAIDCKA